MTAASDDKHRQVTALFDDGGRAARAYQACVERGYQIGEVNAMMSEETRRRCFADSSEATTQLARRTAEGGELGGPTGGRIEIFIAIAAAVGTALALPALGFVAAGPLAAALTAAGAAGLASGLAGALAHWGIPQDRLHHYEAGLRDGGILMMVQARSDEDARAIEQQWKTIGGRDVFCC